MQAQQSIAQAITNKVWLVLMTREGADLQVGYPLFAYRTEEQAKTYVATHPSTEYTYTIVHLDVFPSQYSWDFES